MSELAQPQPIHPHQVRLDSFPAIHAMLEAPLTGAPPSATEQTGSGAQQAPLVEGDDAQADQEAILSAGPDGRVIQHGLELFGTDTDTEGVAPEPAPAPQPPAAVEPAPPAAPAQSDALSEIDSPFLGIAGPSPAAAAPASPPAQNGQPAPGRASGRAQVPGQPAPVTGNNNGGQVAEAQPDPISAAEATPPPGELDLYRNARQYFDGLGPRQLASMTQKEFDDLSAPAKSAYVDAVTAQRAVGPNGRGMMPIQEVPVTETDTYKLVHSRIEGYSTDELKRMQRLPDRQINFMTRAVVTNILNAREAASQQQAALPPPRPTMPADRRREVSPPEPDSFRRRVLRKLGAGVLVLVGGVGSQVLARRNNGANPPASAYLAPARPSANALVLPESPFAP